MAPPDPLTRALDGIAEWGASHVAAAVITPDGSDVSAGDVGHVFRWASITKLLTGWAVLRAVDDRAIDLDEPAPPPAPAGATVRHLLAHASGLPFDGEGLHGRPGTRRIYSNVGYDLLGALLAERDGRPFESALRLRVLDPLGMHSTVLRERPSQGLHGPLSDLIRFVRELSHPTLVRPATVALATHVVFPGLPGVLPGVGRFDVLDWGLAVELRDGKDPHWTGTRNDPSTFGHFGGSGTFVWVDPVLDAALVCLTDREFGAWALEAWPPYSDGVIRALRDAV